MKKFERLSLEERQEEIQNAALKLFNEKGFAATTMENIVSAVSLSKGGVYRIYPSTASILGDLMIKGMHLRNAFYEEKVTSRIREGKELTLEFLVDMIGESLLMYPEVSKVYVEFLWEKQRNPSLQKLYEEICKKAVSDTEELISKCGADALLSSPDMLCKLTQIMNTAIMGIHVLGLWDVFKNDREKLDRSILNILKEIL